MRLKAIIEYDGTSFYGWQVQPARNTVQAEIEKGLTKITGEEIRIHGAGRTDAGVHAAAQVASFDYGGRLPTDRLKLALNSLLPRSIYIKGLMQVRASFDARRDALGKLYRYRIIRGRSPLRRRFAWEFHYPLDIQKMKKASEYLVGSRDYAALCEVSEGPESLTVDSINIKEEADEITIDIKAKAFLYKMVRRMVGVATECGRGKIEPEIIPGLFRKDKPVQTITAPANGLVLVKVFYQANKKEGG